LDQRYHQPSGCVDFGKIYSGDLTLTSLNLTTGETKVQPLKKYIGKNRIIYKLPSTKK
jgi:hypothetical protein